MEGRAGDGGDNLQCWFPSKNAQAPFPQPPESHLHDMASSQHNHFPHRNPSTENNYFRNSDSQYHVSLNPPSQNYFALNPISQNHFSQTENRIPVSDNHPQNLSFRCLFNQNPTQQNHLLQNPILQNTATENQPSDLFYPTYPYEHPIDNPGFINLQSSENSLSRLNESAPSRRYQFPGNYSFSHSSPSSYPFQNQETNDLQSHFARLSMKSPPRRYSIQGDQFNVNDQGFNDLGLLPPSLTDFANNHQYWKNLAPLTNQAAAVSNVYPLGSRSQPRIEPVHGSSSVKPNSNLINGTRFDFGSYTNQSINASVPLSSRVNNLDPRPPQRLSFSSMEELRGRICSVAKDQHGCRFLQKKVDERNPKDIEIILPELKDELHELMVHQFANYLIQKLIGVLNEEQMTKLIRSLVNSQHRFSRICEDLNGSRVMQKLLDASDYPHRQPLTPEQKSLLVSALKNITVTLSKSVHGYHVIQRCLQKFSSEYTQYIVEKVAENCLNLATDKSGCCLLQHCILHANEEKKGRLIADIVASSLFLSEHSYGNYVVQYVLGLKIPQVTGDIIAQLAGNFYTLAQGKSSSNVVEKCLRESSEEKSAGIINEIMQHPEVLELMLHPYGNYVIQSAWMISEDRPIRQSLYHLVEMNSPFLQSHIYGKKVLATIRGNKNRIQKHV